MSDSIEDILRVRKTSEPAEFAIIRNFVEKRCNITPRLATSAHGIIVSVPNGSIAGHLRMQIRELEDQLDNIRLTIRIQ